METQDMQRLIVVKQLPVIEERLKTMSEEVQRNVDAAVSLACTEETKKTVKETRAVLRKQFSELEEQRKAVKKAVLDPYNAFESSYKKYIQVPFLDGDSKLKQKIATVEDEMKQKKRETAMAYFSECKDAAGLKDFPSFEELNLNITLSVSETKLRKEISDAVESIRSDVAAISSAGEDAAELMTEYRKNGYDLASAFATIQRRKEAVAAEQERIRKLNEERQKRKEHEAEVEQVKEAFSAPEVGQAAPEQKAPEEPTEPIIRASFTVQGTRTQLINLRRYIEQVGIVLEK